MFTTNISRAKGLPLEYIDLSLDNRLLLIGYVHMYLYSYTVTVYTDNSGENLVQYMFAANIFYKGQGEGGKFPSASPPQVYRFITLDYYQLNCTYIYIDNLLLSIPGLYYI